MVYGNTNDLYSQEGTSRWKAIGFVTIVNYQLSFSLGGFQQALEYQIIPPSSQPPSSLLPATELYLIDCVITCQIFIEKQMYFPEQKALHYCSYQNDFK